MHLTNDIEKKDVCKEIAPADFKYNPNLLRYPNEHIYTTPKYTPHHSATDTVQCSCSLFVFMTCW